MIETAAKITTLESWTKIGALDMGAMEVFKKRGNVIIELAPEVQAAAYKLGREWADQKVAAAKDPWFKRILDSQRKFEEGWRTVERNRIITYT